MTPRRIQPVAVQSRSTPDLCRTDYWITGDSSTRIGVREILLPEATTSHTPVIMLHGARVSGIPSFDLDVPGGSFATEIARYGFPIYVMDARNYGRSSRSEGMSRPPEESDPLTRSEEVVRDLHSLVGTIRSETEAEQVALLGWATGGQWCAHYAAEHPSRVSHLITVNSLWPINSPWLVGDALEDPEKPGNLRPAALGGYGLATADALLGKWTESIPSSDPGTWRDPSVAREYANLALAMDPEAERRKPQSLRTPLGAIADSFRLSRGNPIFNPARITAKTLVVRSELDFWSREIDLERAEELLSQAADVMSHTLAGATHFTHLDRPERGRDQLVHLVLSCLRS